MVALSPSRRYCSSPCRQKAYQHRRDDAIRQAIIELAQRVEELERR